MVYNFDKGVERRGTDAKKFNPQLVADDVLPFWIGDTEFECPIEVKEALLKRVELGHYGYPYINSNFSESVARWYKVRHNTILNPNYIDFSPSIIPSMIWCINEFSSIGDKVLIQTPLFPLFHEFIVNNGRRLICNELKLINGRYEIDFNDLEEKLKDTQLKIMFICNPQNPTGRCFTKEELTKIGELCIKYNVLICVDEIYADIVFDNIKFIPFCSISEEFAHHSITFLSPSKTFNVAGFRTAAWFTHNKKLYDGMMNQQNYVQGMGRNIMGTEVLITCYNKCDSYADQVIKYLNEIKNDIMKYFRENIKRIKAIEPESTFVLWLDCRELGFATEKELIDFFVNKAKVLLSEGTTFGAKEGFGFMRFNFAAPKSMVMEGLYRIEKAVGELK